jgi:hypothetical protein
VSTGQAVLSLPLNCNLLHTRVPPSGDTTASLLISQIQFPVRSPAGWNLTCNVPHVNKVYYFDLVYGIMCL